jgi:hypothetical protein
LSLAHSSVCVASWQSHLLSATVSVACLHVLTSTPCRVCLHCQDTLDSAIAVFFSMTRPQAYWHCSVHNQIKSNCLCLCVTLQHMAAVTRLQLPGKHLPLRLHQPPARPPLPPPRSCPERSWTTSCEGAWRSTSLPVTRLRSVRLSRSCRTRLRLPRSLSRYLWWLLARCAAWTGEPSL